MAEIETAQDSNKQTELIDSAIIASAKEAQEEAKKALAKAAEDQKQARRTKQDAALLVRASEERRKQDIERAEARKEEAVRNEQARADEAAKNATERHERAMQKTRETYDRSLQEKDQLLKGEVARVVRMSRRIRFAVAAAVLVVIFIFAGLAGLFSEAWEYFVAAVAIASFFGVLDQFINRQNS